MSLNPKVSDTLNRIVELFRTGNVPQAISIATFPPFDVPSNAWSLSNRIRAFLAFSDACTLLRLRDGVEQVGTMCF